jgi:hypothetical protein
VLRGGSAVYLVPSKAGRIEDKRVEIKRDLKALIPQFKKFAAAFPMPASTINPDGRDIVWYTGRSERPLTANDIDKLASGEELLFLFYDLEYTDPRGSHYIHRCEIAQTPAFNPEIWTFCDGFQDYK